MLNPCITINYKITKHKEGGSEAACVAHLKFKIWNEACGCGWDPTVSPCEAELEPSALVYGSCGTTASGLAASRLGSPSSGFSPGATAYLASRGQGKHALPLDGYLHVNELVPPARGWGRLWLVAGVGQWRGDWRRGTTWSGRFKGQEGAGWSPNMAPRDHFSSVWFSRTVTELGFPQPIEVMAKMSIS